MGNSTSEVAAMFIDDPETAAKTLNRPHQPVINPYLVNETHFSSVEFKFLKEFVFDKMCGKEGLIDMESFTAVLSEDTISNSFMLPKFDGKVISAVFMSMDMKCKNKIDFQDFIRAVSVACRGTVDEKTKFLFDLILRMKNVDKKEAENNSVKSKSLLILKDDMIQLLKMLKCSLNEKIYQQYMEQINEYCIHSEIDHDKFIEIAKKISSASKMNQNIVDDGFGIFYSFYVPLLAPIEKAMNSPNKYEIQGYLDRSEKLGGKWNTGWFNIKGGILTEYKDETENFALQLTPLHGYHIREIIFKNEIVLHLFRPDILDPYIAPMVSIPHGKSTRLTKQYEEFYIKSSQSMKETRQWLYTIAMYTLEEKHNAYNSYAPIRKNVNAIWYVNAKPCFERMADAIENAKEEIFVTCWFISPEVFLRRNVKKPQIFDRFDMMLKKKAEEGVMIYMILWKETKIAQAGLKSSYAGNVFSSLHPNFKIMRHPPAFPFVWAHHQKLLVIDQDVAFHGGLDVCWGRWDDTEHRIEDSCHFCLTWPGKDYFNPTLKGTSEVWNPHDDHIDRLKYPRLPWHDLHMELDGEAARDVAKNFIERWNNHRNDMINSEINLADRYLVENHLPILSLKTTKPVMNMLNPYKKKICVSSPPKRIIPDNIREKIFTKDEEAPCFFPSATYHEKIHELYKNKPVADKILCDIETDNIHTCTVQMVRSLSPWSGSSALETSLYSCYLDIINRAEHYIFIENQYFISNTAGFGVQNRIADAILNRIRWAIKNDKTFRVIIMLPVQPDGRFAESSTCRYIMYWDYKTINRGGGSLLETLEKEFPTVSISDYVAVFALRTHDFICDTPVTEQIYTHGKLLIVDDKYVLLGSGNVNDRSFLGYRDSEFATLVEDQKEIESVMDGKPYKANRFALSLRLFLWREFLGLCEEETYKVLDPVCNECYKHLFMKTALRNTNIYQEVFPYAPSDNISSWDKVVDKTLESTVTDMDSLKKLEKVRGFLILWPLNLLNDGSLEPHLTDWESKYINHQLYQ